MKSRSILAATALVCAYAFQQSELAAPNHLLDPFATGWLLIDTSGDGIADLVAGKVVVPDNPGAAENAAAANIAARLGYGSTGLTPPVVVTKAQDTTTGLRVTVSIGAADGVPVLEQEEGGVFLAANGLRIVGADEDGLLAAAEAYAARAPYVWRVPGEKLKGIEELTGGRLDGVTYLKGKAGIHRAFLSGSVTTAKMKEALASPRLASVHELVHGADSAVSDKPEAAQPAPAPTPPAPADATPTRLDLATLYS
jgi:hypothetical protein